jgi:hypothetical protein
MPKRRITVWEYACERCGHRWVPRGPGAPRICPTCKSPYWDTPRRKRVGTLLEHVPVGGYVSRAEAERIVLDMMTPPD